jgi:hypothetical protein
MIDNKRYVCYVIHSYADFDKRDKVLKWHYDVKNMAYFTNKDAMKRWMRKQRKAVPFGSPIFYIYLEGENKVYEKYVLHDRGLSILTQHSQLDTKGPNTVGRF